MKVKDLIQKLSGFDPELNVVHEDHEHWFYSSDFVSSGMVFDGQLVDHLLEEERPKDAMMCVLICPFWY